MTELPGGDSWNPRWPGGPPDSATRAAALAAGAATLGPPHCFRGVLSGRGWRMDPELQPDLVSRAADQHMVGTRRQLPRVELVRLVDGVVEGARLVGDRVVGRWPVPGERHRDPGPRPPAGAVDEEDGVPVAHRLKHFGARAAGRQGSERAWRRAGRRAQPLLYPRGGRRGPRPGPAGRRAPRA